MYLASLVTSQCDSPLVQPIYLQKKPFVSSWFLSLLRSQSVAALNGKTVNGPQFPLMMLYFSPYHWRVYLRLSLYQSLTKYGLLSFSLGHIFQNGAGTVP